MFMSDLNDLSDSQLDVMAKNKDGATALHLAACGSKSVVFFPEKKVTTLHNLFFTLSNRYRDPKLAPRKNIKATYFFDSTYFEKCF